MSSSPSTSTQVNFSATINILGQTVVVNSSGGNFVFNLSQPVTLGSVDDFIDKVLREQLHLPVSSDTIKDLETKIPVPALQVAFNDIFTSPIVLTTLYINYSARTYAFGVTVTFTTPISILGLLQFEGIGFSVSNTSPITSP
jgi:hypothetical protein